MQAAPSRYTENSQQNQYCNHPVNLPVGVSCRPRFADLCDGRPQALIAGIIVFHF